MIAQGDSNADDLAQISADLSYMKSVYQVKKGKEDIKNKMKGAKQNNVSSKVNHTRKSKPENYSIDDAQVSEFLNQQLNEEDVEELSRLVNNLDSQMKDGSFKATSKSPTKKKVDTSSKKKVDNLFDVRDSQGSVEIIKVGNATTYILNSYFPIII